MEIAAQTETTALFDADDTISSSVPNRHRV